MAGRLAGSCPSSLAAVSQGRPEERGAVRHYEEVFLCCHRVVAW